MEEVLFEQVALIIAVNLALYLKTLRYKFVSDDFSCHKNPPPHKNWLHRWYLNFLGMRKIYSRTLAFGKIDGKWKAKWIQTEEGEHLYALFLHILACILIFIAFGKGQVAFITAMLYSVNPVNNQGTIWPSGRGYVYPIIGLVGSMAFPILSPFLLTFCASFTVGFLAPLALIGSDHYYLLALMPFVWLFHARKFKTAVKSKSGSESFAEDKRIHPRKLILAIKTFGFYLTLCIIPFRITFYHNFLQSAAGAFKYKCYTLCRYFWIGLTALVSISIIAAIQWDSLSWALFAFCITIAPFCNFVRANQEIAERFVALPNVFLMYALAQIIVKIGG